MGYLLPSRGLFSIEDLSKEQILGILDRAEELRQSKTYPQSLADKIVGLLFFQPSTRTRIGFHCAALRLGGGVVELTEPKSQPGMGWPESLEDTVRVVSDYCDLLVLRHPNVDTLLQAVEVSSVPIINAGAGQEHHPTQTLIDLFAIRRRFGKIEGLRVGLVGDLASSRGAKSLVRAMRRWPPTELRLVAPEGRQVSDDVLQGFDRSILFESNRLDAAELDVLYVAGLPNVAGTIPYGADLRTRFAVTPEGLEAMPERGVVLCPLPRVDEIAVTVDALPEATYFSQSAEGLFVRAAVLEYALTCVRGTKMCAVRGSATHLEEEL
jgi:aspartate carbamoyltransferase catalytic subunit